MDAQFYLKDGRQYDRITRILDYFPAPQLVDWKLRVGKAEAGRISRKALSIGTNLDEVVKAEIDGVKPPKLKTAEAKTCHAAFNKWAEDYSLKLRPCQTVFCEELGVAGTPDIEDSDTVIDLKCAASIKLPYWLQTEFYGRMLGKKFKAILRLDKEMGTYEYERRPLSDYDWEIVKSAVNLYRYYNQGE